MELLLQSRAWGEGQTKKIFAEFYRDGLKKKMIPEEEIVLKKT